MSEINVGQEFYHRLANRDRNQGDGKHTAVEFRKRFLSALDDQTKWDAATDPLVLSFKHVKKIGHSFAKEALGYFTKYGKPKEFMKRVKFVHITNVQRMIIEVELESGYSGNNLVEDPKNG